MNCDLEQFSEESLKELVEHIDQMPDALGKVQFAALARIALAAKQAKSAALDRTNAFTDEDLEGIAHGNNPVANAYRELLTFRRAANSPVIPDGWKLVPIEPTEAMLDEFDNIIDFGAEDSCDAWRRLIAATPKPESE